MTLKNRVVMMPMGSDFAGHDGKLSDEHIKYYELRARGGTGLIMVENVCVKYPEGSNGTTQLRLDKDCYIPRLFTLTEACHRQGALMGIQINHAGASAMSSRIGMQPVSASRFPSKAGGEIPRGLSKEEIASIAKDYGTAAKRAVNAGFDVVEIHAGHSYLISQFLSPTTNDRTDEFGGSAEKRARFCRMVIDEVRKAVGPRVPISLRLSVDELPNLTIKTGVDATVAEIKKYTPDLVVNATGSVPLLPPIEGLHDNLGKKDASVYSIKDMIAYVKNYPEDMTGKKVVVVGGGAVGLDVVEFFAPRGAETTIIEMMPVIGNGLDASSTSSMKECMEKHHVRQMTNTALQKVNAHSFLVKYDGKEEELPFDYGFVCLGMRANAPIWNDIQEAFYENNYLRFYFYDMI
ncbi:oxidoreductase [Dorea longicatena]|uniref:oxidoreductase n=1 Tax=Dorea longicatena TaxID=88431 RepID=UPI003F8A5F34